MRYRRSTPNSGQNGTSWLAASSALLLCAVLGAGCASTSSTEEGAVIGAAAGGVIGGVIDDNTTRGAIIGAVVGGTAGAVIGRQMDKQAEQLEGDLDADVERIGEGIRVTFASGILFAYDSSELQSTARENLADLARSLMEYPRTEVLVVGHTDATGSEQYNQGLSERRAESAASFLAQRGVDWSRIRAEGRGELEPKASNADETGRQLNRRVEVAIFASEEYREELRRRHGGY